MPLLQPASDKTSSAPARGKVSRPLIGLALGSGVARGWAHIGVLRTLEEAGFAPDIIAGTSIGAVAGGCYAAGKLTELEDFARTLTRRRLFSLLDLRLGGSGLIRGRRFAKALRDHLGGQRIESLSREFISVTAELATGHEIWIREGPLVEALQASYALPGVFSPVHHEGRWLIDGALVNPVPVSVCRAFGARLVIAVNLNRDAFGKASTSRGAPLSENGLTGEEPPGESSAHKMLMRQLFGSGPRAPGLTSVMLAALNIVQDRLARSRMAGDPPDVTIAPRVGHISLLGFEHAEEAIELGRAATGHVLPWIEEAMEILV